MVGTNTGLIYSFISFFLLLNLHRSVYSYKEREIGQRKMEEIIPDLIVNYTQGVIRINLMLQANTMAINRDNKMSRFILILLL